MMRVGDFDASNLVAHLPAQGAWAVVAELVGGRAPAIGEQLSVLIGDLTLVGTVTASGVHAGAASAYVEGGVGWSRTTVERRTYRDDAGVPLREVAGDLALEAGERIELEADVAAMTLGYAWTRPAGLAVDALSDLGVPWWIDFEGVTHLGQRPAVESEATFALERYEPARGRATLVSPDDAASGAQPGSVVIVDGLRFAIAACTVHASASRVAFEIQLGAVERLAHLLEKIQARGVRRAQLAAVHSFRVVLQVGDQLFLQALRPAAQHLDLPDLLPTPVSFGLQGVSQQVRLGDELHVAFEGGDLGAPIVVGWRGGPARSTSIDATEGIALGASLVGGGVVSVGNGTRAVAMGDAVELWAAAAHDLLIEIVASLAPVPMSPLALAAEAELVAYAAANGLGWSSTRLETS